MLDANIASLRLNYKLAQLDEADLSSDPFNQFRKWFKEALEAQIVEANAMCLSTVNASNKPHSRIVLLKDISEQGFVFFTNYESLKSKDIEGNQNVTILFFWKELQRQVRIEGIVNKVSDEISSEYFNSRPRESQLGAIASNQSEVIPNRQFLENKYNLLQQKYINTLIERPENWGGFQVVPNYFEFWQGRESRLHDRFQYIKTNDWIIERLSP
jgi:pyridoxamine 5'-phosphate oxidase